VSATFGTLVVVVALLAILLFATWRRALARLLHIEPPRFHFTSSFVQVPGAEGSSLTARVYRPSAVGSFPVVVVRTPYGLGWRGGPPGIVNHVVASLFCERGVIVCMQSCRGRFARTHSGQTNVASEFVPFVYEHDDGTLLLDWIARQPWFTGKLALYGQSYAGYTSWACADDPRVTAIVPVQTSSEFRSLIHPDGVFALETALRFMHVMETFGNERSPPVLKASVDVVRQTRAVRPACEVLPFVEADRALIGREDVHFRRALAVTDDDDPFWRAIDHRPRRDGLQAPALVVAGFMDPFVRETVRDFVSLRARGHRARMVIGPWTHGQLDARYLDETFRFLRAGDESGLDDDGVRIVCDDGTELSSATWPPPSSSRVLFLDAQGELHDVAPRAPGTRAFTHHPDTPVPNIAGAILDLEHAGVADNRALLVRDDVVTFVSKTVLNGPLRVVGEPSLTVRISSTRACGDLFVRLLDVDARGVAKNVTDGFVRVDDDALTGEGVTRTLVLWPTGHTFAAGHRVALLACGAAHPRFARNLGTRGAQTTTSERYPARHTLHLEGARLELPVVETAQRSGGP